MMVKPAPILSYKKAKNIARTSCPSPILCNETLSSVPVQNYNKVPSKFEWSK